MSEGNGPAVLGRLEDYPDRSVTPASYRRSGRDVALLVVRRGDEVRAYLDLCPHAYLPITYRGRRVLSADGERLRCTNHGAEFSVEDGRPLGGPGGGCGLTPVTLSFAADGTVLVDKGRGRPVVVGSLDRGHRCRHAGRRVSRA